MSKYDILIWAEKIIAIKNGPPHLVLELKETASVDEVQTAFHKVARTAHPDLHRNVLTAQELELLTSAYAAVAGAYMQMRSLAANRPASAPSPAPAAPHRPTPIPAGTGRTPPAGTPTAPPPPSSGGGGGGEGLASLSSANAAQQMSQKAMLYFRKAELKLKSGDLKGALLQLKLAIAADPHSTFLRNALAEVDAELRRTT